VRKKHEQLRDVFMLCLRANPESKPVERALNDSAIGLAALVQVRSGYEC